MEEREAFQLLTLASARDNRTVSQSVAAVWASDLEDVVLEDAVAALTLHYRERPDVWLQPGHVIAGARRVREVARREANKVRAIEPNVVTLDRAEFDRMTQESIEAHRLGVSS